MTPRKKKGIGFFITGAVFAVAGGAMFWTEVTPEWIATAMQVVGALAAVFGFTVVFPDYDS
jgi:hypothetical protein